MAGLGKAGQGSFHTTITTAGQGQARRCMAWLGRAWRVGAWHGRAGQGKVSFTSLYEESERMVTKTKSTNRVAAALDAPPTMKPEIVVIRVVGISPLLQNNPASLIGATEQASLGTKKTYDDKEEAELRVYRNEEGQYYHPTQAFIKAMLRAVTGKKFGKTSAPGMIRSSVFMAEPHSILLDGKGKEATKYTIDRQSVVVGKARILRCRPCWNEWQMDIALDIDCALVSSDMVRDALSLAGRTVGIGDYRPEKSGGFGRFSVR